MNEARVSATPCLAESGPNSVAKKISGGQCQRYQEYEIFPT